MVVKEISDGEMLAAVGRDIAAYVDGWGLRDRWGVRPLGAVTRSIAEREGWPVKIVTAKLRTMLRRGLVIWGR